MAIVSSRDQLIDYCKRRLGEPVLKVNVAVDQAQDRLDDALQYYNEFHTEASHKTFYKHTLTQQDIDNKYIEVPEDILCVLRIMPINGDLLGTQAQYAYDMLRDRAGFDLVDFELRQQNYKMIQQIVRGARIVNFARNMGRVTIYDNWESFTADSTVLVFETIESIDPDAYTKIYNDIWLKEYCTELIKQQWGTNLKKFNNVQLPGGITLDGESIYNEASERIKELQLELEIKYNEPDGFIVG